MLSNILAITINMVIPVNYKRCYHVGTRLPHRPMCQCRIGFIYSYQNPIVLLLFMNKVIVNFISIESSATKVIVTIVIEQ